MSQYQSYSQWKDWPLNFTCSESERLYFEREFGGIIAPGRRIFEIGFGNGGFLSWARSRGAEVYGVEIQSEILAAAERHGFVVAGTLDELLPHRGIGFDAAVALDVFEHIPAEDIPQVLSSIENLLKPSGSLTLRVPNGLSPFVRYNQYGDATHTNVVTPSKMDQWAFATQLRVQCVRNEARVPYGANVAYRFAKHIQFAMREFVSRAIAAIYGLPVHTLDANLMIVMKKKDGLEEAD
ncbi:MAG TPA: class I SAM-dependent methyltransferase [Acidobacteriaceae bacterium]|nr:class I SAM-dependent methyltransferase [Acidobacteriaceae bacterium]